MARSQTLRTQVAFDLYKEEHELEGANSARIGAHVLLRLRRSWRGLLLFKHRDVLRRGESIDDDVLRGSRDNEMFPYRICR